jgi:hypothetical protein
MLFLLLVVVSLTLRIGKKLHRLLTFCLEREQQNHGEGDGMKQASWLELC